jgi:hypothetical protein
VEHNSKWTNTLDIDYWTEPRTQAGRNLQTETDNLFWSAVDYPNHPNLFVTLGLCKLIQSRALTQAGKQVHNLFSATYWDEQGRHLTAFNQPEHDLDLNHDNLHRCATASLQRIHHYSLEAVTYLYSTTSTATPVPPTPDASTIMDDDKDNSST